ncbi:hypothetical protein M0P48_02230 [Candidatus Gracilibacteria bacterium]|nr:hypothetical protein [Candidatus Gracilibacteria bacterium]
MTHLESQPGKNIVPKEKVEGVGEATKLWALNKLKKIASSTSVTERLFGATKKMLEQAEQVNKAPEQKRNEADKLCQEVISSGILTSPEYKKLKKELRKAIKRNIIDEYNSNAEGNVKRTIKGKNGKQYTISLSFSDNWSEDLGSDAEDSTITFLDKNKQEISISVGTWGGTGIHTGSHIVVTRNEESIIGESSRVTDDHLENHPDYSFNMARRMSNEDRAKYEASIQDDLNRKTQEADASYDMALSKPNISKIVQHFGGLEKSNTKGSEDLGPTKHYEHYKHYYNKINRERGLTNQ